MSREIVLKRVLIIHKAVHLLYETDNGHHRTMCGMLTKEGLIEHRQSSNCAKCNEAIASTSRDEVVSQNDRKINKLRSISKSRLANNKKRCRRD